MQARVAAHAAAASIALAVVVAIVLGYAIDELTHPGAFGGKRVAYPFLIATGLRIDGAAWLLLLCATASVVPLLTAETPREYHRSS